MTALGRISVLLPDLRGGGVERIRLVLAREFKRLGYEVEFVLMSARGELLQEAESEFDIYNLTSPRLRNVRRPLRNYLKSRKPELLLSAMWPLSAVSSAITKGVAPSTKVVVSEHVDLRVSPSLSKVEKFALRTIGQKVYNTADAIVGVSSGVADSIAQVTSVPRENITVIHNPVRPANDRPASGHTANLPALWLGSSCRLIGVGSLKTQKRFDVLFESFRLLKNEVPDAQLLILGEGSLREELEALAKGLGLQSSIHMPGFRNDVQSCMALAHCFVLSSEWEGFGNVLAEALSVGCPVVSTDCPSGPAEILGNGKFGRLALVNSPETIATAVQEVLRAPPDRRLLLQRSADFSPDVAAKRYLHAARLQ